MLIYAGTTPHIHVQLPCICAHLPNMPKQYMQISTLTKHMFTPTTHTCVPTKHIGNTYKVHKQPVCTLTHINSHKRTHLTHAHPQTCTLPCTLIRHLAHTCTPTTHVLKLIKHTGIPAMHTGTPVIYTYTHSPRSCTLTTPHACSHVCMHI